MLCAAFCTWFNRTLALNDRLVLPAAAHQLIARLLCCAQQQLSTFVFFLFRFYFFSFIVNIVETFDCPVNINLTCAKTQTTKHRNNKQLMTQTFAYALSIKLLGIFPIDIFYSWCDQVDWKLLALVLVGLAKFDVILMWCICIYMLRIFVFVYYTSNRSISTTNELNTFIFTYYERHDMTIYKHICRTITNAKIIYIVITENRKRKEYKCSSIAVAVAWVELEAR